ncbi:hypothetical protein [Runella sp.]|uniref:hypothetical protein n=1 Tax=Runella sp. TaxID=1960881 RepID=UPI003D0E22C0
MARNTKFDLARFHFEHSLWLNETIFVEQEIDFFSHLVHEMRAFLPVEEIESHFEETLTRFEREFDHFKRTIKNIQADLRDQEGIIASVIKEQTEDFNEEIRETQTYLREKMVFFHDNYRKLKTEFKLFVSKDLEKHIDIPADAPGAEK